MSCADHPLPIMFVSRDYDHCVIGNYLKKKHGVLSSLIGKSETTYLYFSNADFHALMDQADAAGASGLRMYFASYCLTGLDEVDEIVRAGYDNLLTLIFAPTDNTPTDLGQYFIFNPNGGLLSIPKPIAKILVSAYHNVKVPLLQAVIADCGNSSFQETQSMWLALDKFKGTCGLVREMDCQGASGLSAFIGTYPVNFVLPEGNKNVSWQLTVVFELAKTIRYLNNTGYIYHFDIEDTDGFSNRKPCDAPSGSVSTTTITIDHPSWHMTGGNTINPCPPSTSNCGSLGF